MADQKFTPEELATEEWRDVVGYKGVYSVSNLGRVRRNKPYHFRTLGLTHIMRTRISWDGYEELILKKKTWKVHKLVAYAFLGLRPSGCQINHKDGNKPNNRTSNLEYVTGLRNMQHAAEMGLMASGRRNGAYTCPEGVRQGEKHGGSKLTDTIVIEIRRLHREHGLGCTVLGRQFGVDKSTVSLILLGKHWKHLL